MKSLAKAKIHEDDDCCTICLLYLPESMLRTPCHHVACKICFERILLTTTNNSHAVGSYVDAYRSTIEHQEDLLITSCPTWGRCPFCRAKINLFDLVLNDDCVQKRVGFWDCDRDEKILEAPFEGCIFQARDVDLPVKSFVFPSREIRKEGIMAMVDQKKLPMITLNRNENTMSDTATSTKQKFFEPGCFFHQKSNTFHGTINWKGGNGNEIAFEDVDTWEVIMQFDASFHYVRKGAILKHRDEAKTSLAHNNPLDGTWRVKMEKNEEAQTDTEFELQVEHSSFKLEGTQCYIQFDPDCIDPPQIYSSLALFSSMGKIPGMETEHKYVLESGLDLLGDKEGPEIGDVITWTTTIPTYKRISWTRVKRQYIPPLQVIPFSSEWRQQYVRYETDGHKEKPTYHSNTLWGNVFIQMHVVGLASYHFISPDGEGVDGAYISYENPACSNWPPLANGSPVPSRVPFVDTSFDEMSKTFRGTIPWMNRYQTTWSGCTSWHYEIVFDTEFTCILSGTVKMNHLEEGNTVRSDVSNYGTHLVYLNAAVLQKMTQMIEVERIDTVDDEQEEGVPRRVLVSLREKKKDLQMRLLEEGASEQTIWQLNEVWIAILDSSRDPVDYNIQGI